MTEASEPDQRSARRNPKALITGGSSGIGREYARQLAAKGFDLVLVARREDRLHAVRDDLAAQYSARIDLCVADLTRPEDVERVAERIVQTANLEFLINNAGFGSMGHFADIDVGRQLDMVQVHVAASLRLMRAALPEMVRRRQGAIINVSSLAGFLIAPGSATYSATKAFLNSFSESLQAELQGTGVRVQSLCPGFTHTGFHDTEDLAGFDRNRIPSGFWMSSESVVAASLSALDSGRVICVPGFKNRWVARLATSRLIRKILGQLAKKKRN